MGWHRDPRRLLAAAVREWMWACEELLASANAHWPANAQAATEAAVQHLRKLAAAYRASQQRERSARPMRCRHCRACFASKDGRYLLGWEGWWLCGDCIVGYIFGDEEPPPPRCLACGRLSEGGQWKWRVRRPIWH